MLKITDLAYSYNGNKKILTDINFSLEQKEILAVVGRNGSGKTTLTKIIMGLIFPDAGKIMLEKEDVTLLSACDMAQKIGYVFQNPDRQLFADTVLDEAMYAPLQMGATRASAELQAKKALADVGLQNKESKAPQSLSRGEKQRLSIASALAALPQILILDEPTSGQDCRERTHLLRLMRQLNQKGMSVILVTHDMDIVAEHADRILGIKSGRVDFFGTAAELFSDEEKTLDLGLELPEAVRISREMGLPMCLTPEEIYHFLERKEKNYA